jgi:hypothetical protein
MANGDQDQLRNQLRPPFKGPPLARGGHTGRIFLIHRSGVRIPSGVPISDVRQNFSAGGFGVHESMQPACPARARARAATPSNTKQRQRVAIRVAILS